MSQSVYRIIAEFKGSEQVIRGFQATQNAAQRTTRAIVEGAKAEQRAVTDARRREREATREAARAVADARRMEQRMYRERDKLRREDLAAQRRYHEKQRTIGGRMAGAGLVGLGITGGGLKVAAGFESAMANLRAAIQQTGADGKIDVNTLAQQMVKLEDLAINLGNRLPGTTADFVEMLTVLKQSGVEVETILGGAGKAVAELAVATDALPKDLAKDFGQYVQQFQVQAKDLGAIADLFARIKAGAGLESGALIEGSKYFQLRAGAPLGLKGLEGARQGALLMASVKELGLEGSTGGTGLANFFGEIANKKKLAALKKNYGIDLQVFDKKGEFLGVENVFKQMEKFRPLSKQNQINALKQLAGDQGMGAGQTIIDKGAEGWARITEKIERASGLQDTINVKTATFNAQLEATLGTAENVAARAFLPLLKSLQPMLEKANTLLGYIEGLAKENPEIAKVATGFLGVGSAVLVAGGGLKALIASYRLWQLTNRMAKGEAIIGFQQVGAAATAAGAKVTAASGYGRQIGSALTSAIKISLVGFAIERYIGDLFDRATRTAEERKATFELEDLQKQREKLKEQIKADPFSDKTIEYKNQLAELDKQIGETYINKLSATKMGGYFTAGSEFAERLSVLTKGRGGAAIAGETGPLSVSKNMAPLMLFDLLTGKYGGDKRKLLESLPKFESATQVQAFIDGMRKSGQWDEQHITVLKQLIAEKYPNLIADMTRLSGKVTDATNALELFKSKLDLDFLPSSKGTPSPGQKSSPRFFGFNPLQRLSSSNELLIPGRLAQKVMGQAAGEYQVEEIRIPLTGRGKP